MDRFHQGMETVDELVQQLRLGQVAVEGWQLFGYLRRQEARVPQAGSLVAHLAN